MRWARRGAQVPKERHCRCGRYGCVELLLLLVGPEESLVNSDPVACVSACVRRRVACLSPARCQPSVSVADHITPQHTKPAQCMHAVLYAMRYALCVLCSPSLPLSLQPLPPPVVANTVLLHRIRIIVCIGVPGVSTSAHTALHCHVTSSCCSCMHCIIILVSCRSVHPPPPPAREPRDALQLAGLASWLGLSLIDTRQGFTATACL